jgi:glycosyltransferase involved in cell wall biosynthesis
MRAIRLTVVLTHPIQYYAPWFRQITAECPGIDLTVLYAIDPTPAQRGVGFDHPFEWDADLLSRYRSQFVREARAGDRLGVGDWFGLHVREIGTALEATHPDVALIPGWHSVTLVRALRACQRLGIPVLYRGDTHLQSAPTGWRGSLWTWRTRRLLRQFSGFLSVGRRSEAFLRYFGASGDRILRAPHAVDNAFFASVAARWQTVDGRRIVRERYGLGVDDFVVLFAGKYEDKKRPLDVIRAAARLSRPVTALMVGAGPLEETCRTEAAALGVQVRWAGFLNQSAMPEAYAAADCLVLPGRETWGLVVNEGLASGLPCIVSDQAGCAPDLIEPGATGERYPLGDLQALTEAIERLRQRTAEEVSAQAAACRQRASQFSFAEATSGLVRACHDAIERHHSPTARSPRVLALCGGMVVPFGLERMTFEVLRVVREAGGAVHVIVNSWESHRITALADAIGASWSVGAYRAPLGRRGLGWRGWLRLAADVVATSGGLLRDAWRFRPTVVLVPELSALLRNWPTLLLLRISGVPTVMRLGNAPSPGRFYRRLWRRVVKTLIVRFVCK